MTRLVAFVFLLLLAVPAGAAKYVSASMPGFVTGSTGGQLDGWCVASQGAGSEFHYQSDVTMIDEAAIFAAGVPGTTVEARCETSSHIVQLEFTINILASCTAGTAGILTNLSTIASIDEFGNMTAATAVPNPQCAAGCIVERPTGTPSYTCSAFLDPTQAPRSVGDSVWVSCTGGTIEQTGQTCYHTGSDNEGLALSVSKPTGYTAEDGEEGEGEEGGGGELGTPVDTTAVCNDANGDGIDDGTEAACSVQAAAAIKALSDAQVGALTEVGTGSTMLGDVTALSNASGGWFTFPASISTLLDPPASCNVPLLIPTISFPGGATFGGSTQTVTGWCAIKTEVEPFLAFGMYILTCFVAFAQFKRV
jgi:hypothetical protein